MSKFYAIFMKMLARALWSICHRGGKERGATATITKTVPRQRSGSGNQFEIPMERWNVRMRAKDGGALPYFGYPMGWRQGNEWQIGHGANTSISYITHAFVHGRSSRGYTFEACVIGAVRVKRCSRSRSSWEVVVLGEGRGTSCSWFVVGSSRSRGDGSRSRS